MLPGEELPWPRGGTGTSIPPAPALLAEDPKLSAPAPEEPEEAEAHVLSPGIFLQYQPRNTYQMALKPQKRPAGDFYILWPLNIKSVK